MKTTGIVRRVDELGRIVLPVELRRTLKIEIRDPLEIYTDGNRIVSAAFYNTYSESYFKMVGHKMGKLPRN